MWGLAFELMSSGLVASAFIFPALKCETLSSEQTRLRLETQQMLELWSNLWVGRLCSLSRESPSGVQVWSPGSQFPTALPSERLTPAQAKN